LTKTDKKARKLEEETERALSSVIALEAQMDICERWTQDSEQYLTVQKDLVNQKLNDAIDTLEHLMIQRFVEQDKLRVGSLCKCQYPYHTYSFQTIANDYVRL
jgi:hypothetical protein